MVDIPKPLLKSIENSRASLFLGAGASIEAGLPSAAELAEHLTQLAGPALFSRLDGQLLDAVAQVLYRQSGYGQQWVVKQIIDFFDNAHRKVPRPPSFAHELMTRIKWRTIFTTNYDRLVELAYDGSVSHVQNVLPIYKPDLQNRRHEEHVVRLIKLNGSVDEAARNCNHELVLTFSEQQKARSTNKEFYSLLQEESINGPIIFIGFQFGHPGAKAIPSSPEFLQLQETLKDMGPAGNWHYCVGPIDENDDQAKNFVDILYENRVACINATYGEFLEAVYRNLTEPDVPVEERTFISVPVGKSSIRISPDDFERDKRHFEILNETLEDLDKPSTDDALNGNANWATFLHNEVIERMAAKDLRELVRSCQLSKAKEDKMLVVRAPAGWGKTFMLRSLAVEHYKAHTPVLWLNPYGTLEINSPSGKPIIIGAWDTGRIGQLLSMIGDVFTKDKIENSELNPIIIADNCAERATEIATLARDLHSNNRPYLILFSVRDSESDFNDIHLLRKARQFDLGNSIYESRTDVLNLIQFCATHGIAQITDAVKRDIVAQRIIDESADHAIILALQIIFDKQHRPFAEIVTEQWNAITVPCAKHLIIRIASLQRFGASFTPRLFSLVQTFPAHLRGEVLEAYQYCLTKKLLFERQEEDEPCVATLHSLVAERLVTASELSLIEIDDNLLYLVSHMTGNSRDLEIVRRLVKRVTDYEIHLSSEEKTRDLMIVAAEATNNDWVICQQFAKFLIQRSDHEEAMMWAQRAIDDNPDHTSLHHTKGNVLRKWGMSLLSESKEAEANQRFLLARQCFAMSRIKRDPDEYGYVTHLEMIKYLIENKKDMAEKSNLLAEGIQLYRDSIKTVPPERFHRLLDDRFSTTFAPDESRITQICEQIHGAIATGCASVYSAIFLAEQLYISGRYQDAISVLEKQKHHSEQSPMIWVKEAEIYAKTGRYMDASKAIDSAKRRQADAEDAEVVWRIMYWEMLISLALEDFASVHDTIVRLNKSGYRSHMFTTQLFPQGYFWRKESKSIRPQERNFTDHAKIWSGRIETTRVGDSYGRIRLTNYAGEAFSVDFQPRYFARRDFKTGDNIKFIMTILPNKVRADDINSRPFHNTSDDLFI